MSNPRPPGLHLEAHPIEPLRPATWILTKRKKLKKKSENYEQTICTSTHHGLNICEVSE